MIVDFDDKVSVLTLVPDKQEISVLMNNRDDRLTGARIVSQTQFSRRIGKAISHDFTGFIVKASVLVIFLLALLFRNPKKILSALIPV